MGKLMRFEFRKLVRQKSFYVCNIVLLVLIFLGALTSKALFDNIEEITQPAPTALGMVKTALNGGNITLIIGIFTALFASEDYSDGTIKNIYSKGYSRIRVYASKLVAVCMFALAACIVSIAGSFLAGIIFFEAGSGFDMHSFAVLISQIIVIVFGYTTLFFAISMVLKKTGSSIAGCIVVPMIFSLAFGMVDSFFHSDVFKLTDYWLDGIFASITQMSVSQESILTAAGVSLIYAAVCTCVGMLINKRQEL